MRATGLAGSSPSPTQHHELQTETVSVDVWSGLPGRFRCQLLQTTCSVAPLQGHRVLDKRLYVPGSDFPSSIAVIMLPRSADCELLAAPFLQLYGALTAPPRTHAVIDSTSGTKMKLLNNPVP